MTNPLRQIGGGMYAPVDVPLANREGCSAKGCSAKGCGTQDTTVLCPCHGRRCQDHDEHEGEL